MGFGQQAESGEASKWVMVREWSGGQGNLLTEVFQAPGRPFRVSYEGTAEDRHGVLDVIVLTRDKKYVTGAYSIQRGAPGWFVVDRPLKELVLEVRSHLMKWRITVDRRA